MRLLLGLLLFSFFSASADELLPEQIEKFKSEIIERAQSQKNTFDTPTDKPRTTLIETERFPRRQNLDEDALPKITEDLTWAYDFNRPATLLPQTSIPHFTIPNETTVALTRLSPNQEVTLRGGSLVSGGAEGIYQQQNLDIRPSLRADYVFGQGYQGQDKKNWGSLQDISGELSFTHQFSNHGQGRLGFAYLDRTVDEPNLHLSGEMATNSRAFYQANAAPLGGQVTQYSIWSRYELVMKSDQKLEMLPFASYAKRRLFHNESLFRVDPIRGDERLRQEEGNRFGLRTIYRRMDRDKRMVISTSVDGQVALDHQNFDVTATQSRNPIRPLLQSENNRTNVEVALKQEIAWTDWLMSKANVDVQWMQLNFVPALAPTSYEGGRRDQLMLNPTAELNIALGKRSTFAMRTGVTRSINELTSLFNTTRAAPFSGKTTNYEIGFETRAISARLATSATVAVAIEDAKYFLDESDLGVVQIQGQRRVSFALTSRYQILSPLYLTGSFTFTRTKSSPKQNPLDSFAFQPGRRLKVGLELEPQRGFYGGVGLANVSDQVALDESHLTVPGWWRLDAELGYRTASLDLQLAFLNLAGAQIWENPIARVTKSPSSTAGSCGPGTTPVTGNGQLLGCEQILFSPGPPVAVNATARVTF